MTLPFICSNVYSENMHHSVLVQMEQWYLHKSLDLEYAAKK